MWHLYNLITEGDSVRATAIRLVTHPLLQVDSMPTDFAGESKMYLPLGPQSRNEFG